MKYWNGITTRKGEQETHEAYAAWLNTLKRLQQDITCEAVHEYLLASGWEDKGGIYRTTSTALADYLGEPHHHHAYAGAFTHPTWKDKLDPDALYPFSHEMMPPRLYGAAASLYDLYPLCDLIEATLVMQGQPITRPAVLAVLQALAEGRPPATTPKTTFTQPTLF